MKVARSESELEQALDMARTEAKAAFGDDAVYLEKYLTKPRHIEVQMLRAGEPPSSQTFWWRRWSEQSRSAR
jgi:acetyl-CoA carboxylase biotin carboxylase subunit